MTITSESTNDLLVQEKMVEDWIYIYQFCKDNGYSVDDHFGLWRGVVEGWWDWVDTKRWEPIPHPKIVLVDDDCIKIKTMAHVLAHCEIFPSISEAKKNGWNKPITLGEHWFFKKTKRVIIIKTEENDVSI